MDRKIKAIVVDDEEQALKRLQFVLEQSGKVEILDTAMDGITAYKKIYDKNPDVVFMDIQMPGMNGIDVAMKAKNINEDCMFVFVSAYSEHAVKAFEIEALDYILKPYNEDRIYLAINRVMEKLELNSNLIRKLNSTLFIPDNKPEERTLSKIPCELYGRILLIDEEEIIFSFIENEQTFIKTSSKKYLTSFALRELEDRKNFFRVHRSFLVNLNKIRELYPWFHGTYKLVMQDDEKTEIPVSRNNVKKLKDVLGI